MAACSSTENKSVVPIKDKSMQQYYLYPPPICRYEDVIASPKFFMDTLGKFHAAMGTKFKTQHVLESLDHLSHSGLICSTKLSLNLD
ncbi:hypothetical protein Tco_0378720 [Tanacetum coccineum]